MSTANYIQDSYYPVATLSKASFGLTEVVNNSRLDVSSDPYKQ
jgi:hypothetical protein